jgi:putative ABC transport system permease protein
MWFLGSIPLVLKRLKSRPGLSLLLVLTTALILGFTAGIPVFASAVSQRITQREVDKRQLTKGWPIFSVRISAAPSAAVPMGLREAAATRDWLRGFLADAVRLPVRSTYVEVQSPMYRLAPIAEAGEGLPDYLAGVRVVHVLDIEPHMGGIRGAAFGQLTDPAQLNVWLEASFASRLGADIGDRFELGDLYAAGQGIPVIVAGVWQAAPAAEDEHFWYRPPETHFDGAFLVTADQYNALVTPRVVGQSTQEFWYFVFDDGQMNLDRVDRYVDGLGEVEYEIGRRLPGGVMDLDPREDLTRAQRRKTSLTLTMYSFSLPVLLIMVSFLSSLSATQTNFQQSEMAIMVSRGATRIQMLGIAALESLLIALLALPGGLALALLLAYLLGFSRGFLSFGPAEPLDVSLYQLDWRPMAAMVAVSIVIRLFATFRVSRHSIITHAQKRARPSILMTGARLALTGGLAFVAYYAYQQLSLRGDLTLASLSITDPRNDPLLLLAPTLFIFVAPLVATELFLLLVHPIDRLGRLWPGVAGYLASTNLARAGGQYRAPTYRLILCLALGAFYASVAKSADLWLVEALQHRHGADLTFRVGGADTGLSGFGVTDEPDEEIPLLPNDSYREIEGVVAATRLAEFEASINGRPGMLPVRYLALERIDFPQVAHFRRDYAAESIGALMNRLGTASEGVLLPASLAAELGLGIGDPLSLNITPVRDMRLRLDLRVAGFFDHFPTMYPSDAPVVVGNLDHLDLNAWDVLPYRVWLRVAPGADTAEVLDDVRRMGIKIHTDQDLTRALTDESQNLERTGIFGLLSICFLAGAVLSVADLLVHSTFMLRERTMVHAVLGALGVPRSKILNMVVLEEITSVVYGLAMGIVCGIAGAILYVPFYRLGATGVPQTGSPVPPFTPVIDWARTDTMALAVAVALLLAESLLLLQMTRSRIFEVLRMGQHV